MRNENEFDRVPIVMSFSCHDPSGGGGIQADIETLASIGCHCAPIITAITARDTCNIKDYTASPATLLIEQARVVLEDMPVAAFKIGLLGSVENIMVIHTLLTDYPDIPVVFKPVLSPVGATPEIDEAIISAMLSLLCPLTTILTPNTLEAQALTPGADTLDACAQKLMDTGCKYLLITGTHEKTPKIQNSFYGNLRLLETFTWERLPVEYLGSGCTLSACIAGLLALGHDPLSAVTKAQYYTWECLNKGYRLGMGQHVPNRLYWADEH